MKKKIGLAGLASYDNLGDQLLLETCRYLIGKAADEISEYEPEVEIIDLQYPTKNAGASFFHILYRVSATLKADQRITDFFQFCEYRALYRRYFKKLLEKCDALIFAGGAYLKYKGEDFQYSIRVLLEIADALEIPVMMNAVGIEGYDENDCRCTRLKKAINRKCVHIITTRDSESFLKEHFIYNRNITAAEVGDPALWAPEYLGLSNAEPKFEVGINVTYLSLFSTYKVADDEVLIDIITKLVEHFESSGITYRFFCNGKQEDYNGAKELCKKLDLPQETLLTKADTASVLVKQISCFKCIIPIRFHSCIIAYSLGRRSAGFLWNHKYDCFLKKTDMNRWFQDVNSLNCTLLFDSVQEAMNDFGLPSALETEKNNTYKYIEKFVRDYV